MPKRIQRKRTKGWRMPKGAVYVGRPTCFGNDFKIGGVDPYSEHHEPMTAERTVELYRQHLEVRQKYGDPQLNIRPYLTGKDLACWCPLIQHGVYVPCHADVLLSIANDIPIDEVINENIRRAKGQTLHRG